MPTLKLFNELWLWDDICDFGCQGWLLVDKTFIFIILYPGRKLYELLNYDMLVLGLYWKVEFFIWFRVSFLIAINIIGGMFLKRAWVINLTSDMMMFCSSLSWIPIENNGNLTSETWKTIVAKTKMRWSKKNS